MKEIEVLIDKKLDGKRVGYIISDFLKLSGKIKARLKNSETGILLDGERVKADKVVKCGERLLLTIPDEESENIEPEEMELDILFEDEDILAVNKPDNMPSHPSKGHYTKTLANGIMHYFKGKNSAVRIITRLDKDTTGIVLVAKNPLAAQRLNDDIANGRIYKEYVAIVNGVPTPEKGEIRAKIGRDCGIKRKVSEDGKEAVTQYETVEKCGEFSRVKLVPVTGRTHQLRVHMSYINCPIYGDKMYGAVQGGGFRLHCRRICFCHPVNGEMVEIKSNEKW